MAFDEYSMIERMVRIETKLDDLIKLNEDKEARLRLLERAIGKVIGFSMTFGAVVGAAFMMIYEVFKK